MPQSYPAHGAASSRSYTFSQKWGDDPFTELGHTQAPNALIEYAVRLALTPDECWLVVCILFFKHTEADPFPSQDKLAQMYGRSVDTVQRICKSLEIKGVLRLERKRNNLGHFSHIVYDFRPLRSALNECYYQDHPEIRPAYSHPAPIPHGCGPAEGKRPNQPQTARVRYRKTAPSHTAKGPFSTPHGCGTNQTLGKENKKDSSLPAASSEKTDPPPTALEKFRQSPEAQQFDRWRQGKR